MKKLFLLLLPAVLISCGGADKYSAPIEELANTWTETTTKVSDFADMMNEYIGTTNSSIASMMLSQEDLSNAGEEVANTYNDAKAGVMSALGGMAPVQSGLGQFMTTWGEKSAELKSLTDGLAAGNLEGDVMGQINGLKEMVSTASTNLTEWQGTFDSTKGNLEIAMEQLTAAYKGVKGE